MDQKKFDEAINMQVSKCQRMLKSKNEAYNPKVDRLESFKTAATIQGVSMKEALAGMMAKHTVSVYDMCMSDQKFPESVWDEKITDNINYLLLLSAVIRESR